MLQMFNRAQRRAFTHSQRLERWIGAEALDRLVRAQRDFYWPVPVHGVPGAVFAMPGGDFTGEIRAGAEADQYQYAADLVRRYARNRSLRSALSRRQAGAFGSLSALIAAGTGGKAQPLLYTKTGVTANAGGNSNDLWTCTGTPGAGAAGGAAPSGTSPTTATTGSLGFMNPGNANTSHFVSAFPISSVINNTLLLYDRLFAVAKTMNSTANEAVSGTFTRYQNQSSGNDDYIGGNFCFPSNPTTVLAATAHNWVAGGAGNGGCTYKNQAGSAANFQQGTGVSACVVHGVDLAVQSWFLGLAAGDVGVKALTAMECSALVATGTIDFVVGHPIAWFPHPIANQICVVDGINTAFNLTKVFDNACLALLEVIKPATTATTYNGQIILVSE